MDKLTGEKIKNMERLKSINNKSKEIDRKKIKEEQKNKKL